MRKAGHVVMMILIVLSLASGVWAGLIVQPVIRPLGGSESWGADTMIGGIYCNSASNGVLGATISGGGSIDIESGIGEFCLNPNSVTGDFGTIGGGLGNTADAHATVSGGFSNKATGASSSIGGGEWNVASGLDSTVGGGGYIYTPSTIYNTASGDYSTVPGGAGNTAYGKYSFAAGCTAYAHGDGTFVWADGNCDMNSLPVNTANVFYVRSSGGVYFRTNPKGGTASGLYLAAGGASWLNLSDRNQKENFEDVDVKKVLRELAGIEIQKWNLKSQGDAIRHIGPFAQDFYDAFRVGEDKAYLNTADVDGVALASIQGLYRIVSEQETVIRQQAGSIKNLGSRIEERDARIDRLEKMLSAIERRLVSLETPNCTAALR